MSGEQRGQNPQSGGGKKCSLKQIVGFRNLATGQSFDSWSLRSAPMKLSAQGLLRVNRSSFVSSEADRLSRTERADSPSPT